LLLYYLTGYPPRGGTGGGDLANSMLMRIGEQEGYSVEVYSSEEEVPKSKPDAYWLSNMNGRFSLEFLQDTIGTLPYVIHDDGYQNLCPQPTREYKLCFQEQVPYDTIELDIEKNTPLYNCREICRYKLMEALAYGCRASICVSPMHGRIWSGIFPVLRDKTIIVEPQIPVTKFNIPLNNQKVPNSYVYIGTIARGKGFDNAVAFVRARGGDMYAAGDIHHTINMSEYKDVHYLGSVSYELVPTLLARMMYLIHLPDFPESQGRGITEALLMGCTIIGNRRVGALSYPWLSDYVTLENHEVPEGDVILGGVKDMAGFRERIYQAPYKFWKDLGEVIG